MQCSLRLPGEERAHIADRHAVALVVLAERAGFPKGVLNVVTGDAVAIGEVMTAHPAGRSIGFTGSTLVGKLLMQQAASTLKKVGLELGGNAPFHRL